MPKTILMTALVASVLAGCAPGGPPPHTTRTEETFTITGVKPPKRLYVDVVDAQGRGYTVYVSKRCSNWRQIEVGSKVVLLRETSRYADGREETDVRVRSSSDVCPG